MKFIKTLLLTICLFWMTAAGAAVFADDYSHTISVFKKSPAVKPFFKDAYGYAVFPTVGKGGIVVGGAYGKGKVYRQGKLTGHVTLSKLSVGFQLGGQAFSEIIFFQDKRAYDEFTDDSYEFGASMSAVVITAGAQASAGTQGGTAGASAGPDASAHAPISYTKGLAVFIHAKGGLMYEAAIGGQRFDFTPL
ncbi:MAG: lipid-binding SYLF domain-containing protein [Desulfotignum sp.]